MSDAAIGPNGRLGKGNYMSSMYTDIHYLLRIVLVVQRYWIWGWRFAGSLTALSILVGTPAFASAPREERQAKSWPDPIRSDVNISGPFLQKSTGDPRDPLAMTIQRCGEPQIAQDSTDPNILIVDCMPHWWMNYQSTAPVGYYLYSYIDLHKSSPPPLPCHTFISRDGGKTWAHLEPNPLTSPLITVCGDPIAVSGPKGELYLGGDVEHYPADGKDSPVYVSEGFPPTEYLGIGFTRSLDGGRTWSSPIVLPTPLDRPFWTVDQSTGTIYDVSSCAPGSYDPKTLVGVFGCTAKSRLLAVSTDQGRTWTPQVDPFNKLPPTASLTQGRQHAIGGYYTAAARGIFATAGIDTGVFPEHGPGPQPAPQFKYSVDEGHTFVERPAPVASSGSPCTNTVIFGLAADPTRRGVFAVLAACGEVPRELGVYVTEDLGVSWSEVAALAVVPPTDYNGVPSDFNVNRPSIVYGPTGALGVLWRQAYGTPPPGSPRPMAVGNIQYGPQDVFLALAPDGKAFGSPIRLNTAASPPPDPRFVGGDDISGLVLGRDYAYGVWGDWRSGELQTWFRKIRIRPTGGRSSK